MVNTTFSRGSDFSENNFDLIRLLAALQVAVVHGIDHLNVEALRTVAFYLGYFPGVPIFFFLSGLLISAAWERNTNTLSFVGNRICRIIPALWVCVLITCAVIVFTSWLQNIELSLLWLSFWAIMQATLFPQWNPEFLNWFGTGVANGSLWTIPVELSFYLILPFVYATAVKCGFGIGKVFGALLGLSLIVFHWLILWGPLTGEGTLIKRLLEFSPIPWFWMFCFGVLVQRNLEFIYPYIRNNGFAFALLLLGVSIIGSIYESPILFGVANDIGILQYMALCLLVLSMGYSAPWMSGKILNRNDISYGTYIYHMVVFNCLILFEMRGVLALSFGLALTLVCATMSWFFIERPFLRRRKNFLYAR